MSLSAGEKLGPYHLDSLIGSGGMGEVWRARDTRLGRVVAIKLMRTRHTARFQQEARAIAALNHPHVCQIHDIGPDYLVLEYIEGTPLRGPLDPEDAVRLAIQIASALEAAHKRGILHRDLKPGNILITESGAKLLDFGLAKVADASDCGVTETVEGTIVGTAAYMSPEQAQSKALDERSDVFSFGAVLYEMLSGRRAFPGDSMVACLSAVIRDDPPPFDAPPALRQIVQRCLRKAPADRFQTMGEVKAALEQSLTRRRTSQPSIAVLPFANLSADKENEYFSDGLAEEILNLLTKIPGLKVIARTSSFAFRGKEQDIRKIAETLGVNHVLEGSIRRAGNRLRVTAQLIHAGDGAHVWSERYDRDMTDIFAIQDQIGQAISQALELRLAPRTQAVNLAAYQHYLMGQYHRLRSAPESLAKAKENFEQALAIDPNYASAHSGLAQYYFMFAAAGIRPLGEVAPAAQSAAQKALAIEPENAEAHSVLGCLAGIFDYDWESAELHHRKAIAVEPVPSMVRYGYALFNLLQRGRWAEAKEQCRLALENDPVSMFNHFGMAWSLFAAREYRASIEYARQAQTFDASFPFLWLSMGFAQLGAGAVQEAIATLQRACELAPWSWFAWAGLAAAYHQTGDRERGRECLKALSGWQLRMGEGLYYTVIGDADAMFEAFEPAFQSRDYIPIYFPSFDRYRADPRFQELVRRMHLA